MNKNLLPVAALVGALGLSACNSFESPEAVMASAYTDVRKNDLKAFRETLIGSALLQYGTADAIAKLHTELTGLQLMTGDRKYLGSEKHSYRHFTYHYLLDVFGRANAQAKYSRLLTGTVICEWYRGRSGVTHDSAGGAEVPDSQECQITDLN